MIQGIEKAAKSVADLLNPTELYHGSPRMLDTLMAGNEHGDPDVDKVVFATPYKPMALAYLGRKWGDRDISQGSTNKKFHLEEMRPGAFNDIYGNQEGYLYNLPTETFKRERTLGSRDELISTQDVKPTSVKRIKNVLEALRGEGVELRPYDPKRRSHGAAIKRMQKRLGQMDEAGREQYLSWVEETNPELFSKLNASVGYSKQLTPDKLQQQYPHLYSDTAHRWRADNDVELMHKEPDLAEFKRIWHNWQRMTPEQQALSDAKSRELFGRTNKETFDALLGDYAQKEQA